MTKPAVPAHSLRRRLLAMLLLTTGGLWLVIAVVGYQLVHREADQMFDAQLSEVADILSAVSHRGDLETVRRLAEPSHPYQQRIRFQIWQHEDMQPRLWLRSENAPQQPMATRDGFSDLSLQHKRWRVFAQTDPDGLQVMVAQNHVVRDDLAETIAWRLLYPLLIALPVLGAALSLVVERALRPLASLAREVGQRHPQHLEAVDYDEPLPLEVRPLVDALNGLLARVRITIEHERNFTADAAHELRTPLAALKVQAQVALRATDDSVRQPALYQVQNGVERMTHLVEQLLTLARLEPEQEHPAFAPVDLAEIAAEVCAERAMEALDQGRELALEDIWHQPMIVAGNVSLLQTLLHNLVGNALRYTPEGTPIEVRLLPGQLSVIDHGPGIPAVEREQVIRRFHRLPGSGGKGSGLGLSIVQRIAELHGARLELADTPGGGLTVSVCWPSVATGA